MDTKWTQKSYAEALDLILQLAKKHHAADDNDNRMSAEYEAVGLDGALGRVTTENVYAPIKMPPYDNSAMDGFAVCSEDVRSASTGYPVTLRVLASVAAGDRPPQSDPLREVDGTCYRINTGAPFPVNVRYDACTPVERIRSFIGDEITLEKPTIRNQHKRLAGEDFGIGHQLIAKNTQISPGHVAVLAAAGIFELRVQPRLRIAVLATGKELQTPHAQLSGRDNGIGIIPRVGQIWNSNGPYIQAFLRAAGLQKVNLLEIVGDDPAEFKRRIQIEVMPSYDVLITTGGVSKGEHDYVDVTLRQMGADVVIQGVRMRPGHPVLVAAFATQSSTKPGLVEFGLPGNPSAAAACLRFLVMPYLRCRMGLQQERPIVFAQVMTTKRLAKHCESACHSDQSGPDYIGTVGVTSFFLAKLDMPTQAAKAAQVELLSKGSGLVSPLAAANCWLKVEGVVDVAQGKLLPCYTASNSALVTEP